MGLREVAIGVAVLGAVVGFLRPRVAVPSVLIWILAVGAFRKWMFNDIQQVLFFAAHPLLLGAYLGYFTNRARRPALPPGERGIAPPLVSILVVWCVAEAFNPALPDVRVGALGLVVRVFYIPFALLVADWATTRAGLVQGMRRYALLALPLLILGLVQFANPHAAEINRYVWGGDPYKAAGGGAVRVTSTFAYIWGYASYLHLQFMLLLVLLTLPKRFTGQLLFYGGMLAFVATNMLMTGTRGAVFISAASLVAFLIALRWLGGQRSQSPPLATFSLGLMICVVALAFTGPGRAAMVAFRDRVTGATDTFSARIADTMIPYGYLWESGFTGFGIGSTYQGSRVLVPAEEAWVHMPTGYEEEPERMLIELGFIGYLLVFAVRFVLVRKAWRYYRRLEDPVLRRISLAVMLFQLPALLHLHVHADNIETNLFFWTSVGVLIALPRLDRQGAKRDVAAAPAWPLRAPRS